MRDEACRGGPCAESNSSPSAAATASLSQMCVPQLSCKPPCLLPFFSGSPTCCPLRFPRFLRFPDTLHTVNAQTTACITHQHALDPPPQHHVLSQLSACDDRDEDDDEDDDEEEDDDDATEQGVVVVRDRIEFQSSRSLFTFNVDITIPSWQVPTVMLRLFGTHCAAILQHSLLVTMTVVSSCLCQTVTEERDT
eukprot:1221496-Rhodomonas_salina.2